MTAAKDSYQVRYDKIDKKEFKARMKHDPETGKLLRQYGKDLAFKSIRQQKYSIPGYSFMFTGVRVLAHDAVWFLNKGEWPPEKIVAVDGDLKNLHIDNLVLESSTKKYLGHYYVRNSGFARWVARVYHLPHFKRTCSFTNPDLAEAWAKKTWIEYNRYAMPTKASAEHTSDVLKCPVDNIWLHKHSMMYEVRIKVGEERKYYCYCKNIEDAMEQQAIGQAEVDEIWGEADVDDISE